MREGAVIGPIIVAIGLVVAAIALAVVGALLQTADGSTELRLERAEAETAQLRSQIDTLRTELRDVQAELDTQAEDVALAAANPTYAPPAASMSRPCGSRTWRRCPLTGSGGNWKNCRAFPV